jgi:hypothetical protein
VTEDELRALVRDAIARHGRPEPHGPAGSAGEKGAGIFFTPVETWRAHASHTQLPLARGGDGDGACLIEPTVRCNHCGYCLSYGH